MLSTHAKSFITHFFLYKYIPLFPYTMTIHAIYELCEAKVSIANKLELIKKASPPLTNKLPRDLGNIFGLFCKCVVRTWRIKLRSRIHVYCRKTDCYS